ncbi:MAG: GDSL-type esterase/lipase family protein [Cytophagaceae bacterium]
MKKIAGGTFLFLLVIILQSSVRNSTGTFYKATELVKNVQGRFYEDKINGSIVYSISGTRVDVALSSTQFDLVIESLSGADSSQWNWVLMTLDHEKTDTLYLKSGKHSYSIKLSGSDKELHTVSWLKCTESFVGTIKFHGIKMHNGSKEADMRSVMKPSFLFIGNSITSGYGNMVTLANPLTGFHAINENAYETYAMKTARLLNSNVELVSYSGIGMYRNFNGDTNQTMPKIFDRVLLHDPSSPKWNHSYSNFDVIVINLGTNDYFLESKNIPLDEAAFVQTYIQFVERLFQLYPKVQIVCANGSMLNDGWPQGKKCFTRVQQNINEVCAYFQSKGNQQVHPFFFQTQKGPYGEDYHPTIKTHEEMAVSLSNYIKQQTWWK